MNTPTNVTPIELYGAIAQFGPLYAAQLGYFNALATSQTLTVSVVAPDETVLNLPPVYGFADIDLTAYNLAEVPVLTGVVTDPIDGVLSYTVTFREVTTTSARMHCHYGITSDGFDRTTLPSFSQTVRVKVN
ncbi:hypothetical protein K7459_12855 [Pseudomonas fluorescens]|uniref:hypothetical protein n=1 Tax=Pseudomonas fluorescens TaxID=294 RepID=UPI0011B947A5|nr:hypothetical protein [Pseudomonas fluorescens]MBY9024556.1 hypothetical protein [Pseudomonas fluorescens]MBY9030929.1 hypothetical protein [Pseudomonas fluorescens]MBY9036932.1 hypothetical protein [Pseudomonas fluorescens]MBY9043038.1 hypothetical protein [Pseudomonas fluorescens]MBY9048458.1 hypothetical protein [Pseudomonas fluorescens]